MKFSKNESSFYYLAGLVAMSLVCSCSTIQKMQSSLEKTAKIEEYYLNQDAALWTAGSATNGTVSSKEFLEIQSTLSPQVEDILAKYGQPDFIRLHQKPPDDINGRLNLMPSASVFNMALLYHSTTNLIVMINQKSGKMSVSDYEEEESRITKLIEAKLLKMYKQEGLKPYEENEEFLACFRKP